MKHRSAIESGLHLHDADSRLGLASEDGVLNRRRAPEAGQQRGMNIDHAARRNCQDLRAQNVAIGNHDSQVRLEPPQAGGEHIAQAGAQAGERVCLRTGR